MKNKLFHLIKSTLVSLSCILLLGVGRSGASTYDLSRDFSTVTNPNGAWSYGYSANTNGSFSLFSTRFNIPLVGTWYVIGWQIAPSADPSIFFNPTADTIVWEGGQAVYPPGAVWFYPGPEGTTNNYGVIRFTVPSSAGGDYRLETAVQHYLNGSLAGDTEFHVLRNGVKIFGEFIAPRAGTGYTNQLGLQAGDRLDFLVGRGADGRQFASGLKIGIKLTLDQPDTPPSIAFHPQSQTILAGSNVTFSVVANGTAPLSYQWRHEGSNITGATGSSLVLSNAQPGQNGAYVVRVSNALGFVDSNPAILTVRIPPTHDLARDFSASSNPSGPWSYGYLPMLNGTFGKLTAARVFGADNGVPIAVWELSTFRLPAVAKVLGPGTAISDGGRFNAPADTVYFAPGADGAPENYGDIRFTVPSGGDGIYRIETAVRTLFDGTRSRDADFHVVHNGSSLFDQFLSPNSGTGYTNELVLFAGDTVDFAIGRGEDGLTADTGLKIAAAITLLTNLPPRPPTPPTILQQPQSLAVLVGETATFSVVVGGTPPLTFQWVFNGSPIPPGTNDSYFIPDTQLTDAGGYMVLVSNAAGSVTSSVATLTVRVPPPPADFDLSRDFSSSSNPAGVWSYGYLTALNGSFGRLPAHRTFPADNGVPIAVWELSTFRLPVVAKVLGPNTAVSDGGRFTAPAGTVYFAPGADGAPENYGAIRFTVPEGASGPYRVEVAVQSLFDGTRSRDADFHIVKSGVEVFGEFLPPNSRTGYTNVLNLANGETLDFAIGRGADGTTVDTGLKLRVTLTRTESDLGDLVEDLIAYVQSLGGCVNTQPLLASLHAAEASFDRGNLTAGMNQLHAFQNKVRAQVRRCDPRLAEELIGWAQRIIDSARATPMPVAARAINAPDRITIVRDASGAVDRLLLQGLYGTSYNIEVSDNLLDWESLGSPREISEGVYELDVDMGQRNRYRFYRAVMP